LTEDDAYPYCKRRAGGKELKDETEGAREIVRGEERRGEERNLVKVASSRILAIIVSAATSMQTALDT
jgi:hypothetical protein